MKMLDTCENPILNGPVSLNVFFYSTPLYGRFIIRIRTGTSILASRQFVSTPRLGTVRSRLLTP